jgi:tetratricopeptide (TPR) repeat protein
MVALLEEKINKNWEAFNKYESELRKALKKELKAETIESEKLKAAYTKLADFYWDRARDGDVVNAYLILTEIKKQVKADSIIQDLDNKLQYAQRQVELWFGDKAKQEIERVAVLFPEKYEFLNIDLQNLSNFVKMNNLANDHELSTAISMGSLSKEKDDSVKLSILIEVREEVKSGLQVCHGVLNKVRCKEQEYQLFEQLALSYLIFEDHHNYPKVIGIYEYMKKLNPNMQEELEERIQNIEAKFVRQIIGSFPDTLLGVDEYILRLASYRNRIKEELKKVGHTDMEHLYLKTNEFFIGENGLVKGLINDCMEELGGLPKTNDKAVKYSIFGMGSMALGTMTPWSDLEFGILIQDGLEKKDSERIKKFFRNLTFLLHIKVIRFGESPLRMLGIKELNDFTKRDITNAETNWFFDDLTKSGFSFDGPHSHACKTPLGRKRFEGHEDFELIGTVEDLCEFQDEKWWKSDPHLVQALNHIILIVGDNELLVSYIKKLGCYKEISKERAFKILKEDAEKLNPVSELVKADREGTILNVKKEIYRFTDRILLAIGDCLGIGNMTNWQLLRQLATEGKLTAGGAKDLKLALGIATELRLRTYANNSGQREDMSALCRYETSIKELQDNELVESVFYLQNLEPLYKYYYVVMSLSSALEKVKENIELKEIVGISAHFYSDTPTAKGYVYKRFLQYYKAIEEFERVEERGLVDNNTLSNLYQIVGRYQDALEGFSKVLKETDKKDYAVIAGTLNNIGNTYESLGKYQEALRYHQESLDMNRRIYKGDHASIAACLNNIGNVCQILGHYEQALQYYRESLKMRKIIYKDYHPDIADSLNNIGNVCQILGHYEQALQYYRESLEMRKKIYKGDHPDITGSLNNLGNIYQRLEKYQKALQYQKESLEMKERIYKGDHASIADSLNNIGNTYESLGKYQEALRYHQESLDMNRRIYKGDHASIAACLNNIGNVCQILGHYEQALQYYRESLKMRKIIYKGDHADIAACLNNIGNVCQILGHYEQALQHHQESLAMRKRIYKGDHADIAACLNNIGNVCQILGHYEQALQHHQESLAMRKRIYKGDHVDVAASLNNIGNVCQILGHYEQALQYYRESLEMRKKIYKGDHPDITGSLNNLGNIYQRLEKYQKALQYQKESLEMKERIYKGDHASIAACLNNIGNTYESLGKYQEALRYHQESLDMSRRIYKGDHASIAACLNNIGNTYESLGKYQEALRYHQESLDMRRRIYKGDHADIAMSLYSLAFLNYNLSAYPEALLYAEKAAIMFRKCLPSDHPNTIISTSLFIECELRTTKLAMLLLNAGQVDKAIECQVILIQTPENLHNLAYMYHVKALTEQGERIITEYLDKANTTFEEAISYQNAPASVYVEYAMLLLKHHKQENSEECKKIIQLLKQTIDKQDESILSYGQGEKITTIWALRKFLDQNIGVTIKPFVLANYLLCKVYHMYGKVEKAQERLDALTAISLSLEGTDDYAIAKYLLEDAEKTKEANPDLNRLINAMPTTHLDAGLATTSISNVMQFDTAISMSSINLSATNQTWEQSSFLGR